MKRGLKCNVSIASCIAVWVVKEDSPMKRGLKCIAPYIVDEAEFR